jgi:UDP-N-acetylenolpyruvoylglucosamine reductase
VLTKPTTIGARHYRVGETATVAEWQAKMLISTGQARIADLRGVYQTR